MPSAALIVEETDGGLVARMAHGDEDAMGDLYDRLGAPLYALAFRMLGEQPLLHTDSLDEALDAAERMIEGYPDGTGFYRAGVVHFAAGRIPEGRRLFKRALERRHELDPADERAIRRRLAAGG